MRKRHFGRLLSAVLSATMVFTSVIPSYAMEGVNPEALEESQEDPEDVAEDSAEDLVTETGEEPVEEVPEEAPIVEDDESSVLVQEGTYTVVFSANAAAKEITGSMDPQEITCGKATALTANAFVRAGYTFANWNTVAEPTEENQGTKYDDKATVTDIAAENGSVTLYAQWTATSATTVSACFNLNYGDAVAKTISDIAEGTKVLEVPGIPTNPERTGYTFDAWYATKNGETGALSNKVAEDTLVTDGATYYAGWTANQYDIVYNFNGGEFAQGDVEKAPKKATFDAAIGNIPDPEQEGKTFAGWNTKADGTGTKVTSATVVDASNLETLINENKLTIYATWKEAAVAHTITFDANGGKFKPAQDGADPEATKQVEVEANGKYPTAPVAADLDDRTGYTLKGWAKDQEATDADYPSTDATVTADETYYAIWEAKEYVFAFQLGGGDFEPDANVPVKATFGVAFGEIPVPVYEGHVFAGWNTVATPDEQNPGVVVTKDTVITAENLDTLVKDNKVTVYAQWKDSFRVAFNTNGGSDIDEQQVVSGEFAVRPATDPTKTGYTFVDWYVSDAADAEKFDFAKTPITKETTIYGKWKANEYPIVFSFENGGAFKKNATKPAKVTFDTAFGDIDDPEKTGYTFSGWNIVAKPTSENPGVEVTKDTVLSGENLDRFVKDGKVTVYATWAALSYTVTYDYGYKTGEVEEKEEKDVYFDAAYPAPNADKLIRTGWYFDGWYNAKGKKVDIATAKYAATEDTTLTGKWVEVTYNVTYNSNINKNATKKIAYKYSTATDAEIKPADVFTKFNVTNTFLGWATEKLVYNTTDNKLSAKALIEGIQAGGPATAKVYNIAVYAQWDASSTYNIAINPNLPDGASNTELYGIFKDIDAVHVESVNYAEPFILNGTELGLYGYTLKGWTYTNAKGKVVSIKPTATLVSLTDVPNATVTLNAQWKPKTYTLKYDLNGGVVANKKTTPLTVKYTVDEKTRAGVPLYNYELDSETGEYVLKDNPEVTKKGYRFVAWSYEYTHYGKGIYADLNVKAYWEPIDYTVKVDPNGGSVVAYETNTYDESFIWKHATYSKPCYLSDLTASRAGYKFKGWTVTGANGKTKSYKANASFNLKDLSPDSEGGDTYTVKADWNPLGYKVKYVLDGGKIKGQPTTYKTGVATKAIPVPTKTGFTFSKWTVKVNGTVEDIKTVLGADNKILATVCGDLEFTANYTENKYTIEFWDKAGTAEYNTVKMEGVAYSGSVDFTDVAKAIEALPSFDTKLRVKGFSAKANGSATYQLYKSYSKLAGKKDTDNTLKLYTITQDKAYRISYELDGGTLSKPVYEYRKPAKDQAIKTKATKKGFTFLGWTASEGAPVVKNNDGFVTAIAKGGEGDFTLTAVYGNENKYTITLAPNAKDVYVVDEATGEKKFVNTKGILYNEGNETQIAYSDETPATELTNYVMNEGWSRRGYDLVGFATDKAGKKMPAYLGGLSDGKKTTVTVYAIWTPIDFIEVEFDDTAEILRNGEHYTTLAEENLGISFSGETTQVFGKAINTKKLSATGYIFKGWKVDEDASDEGYSVVYTDKTKTYVKAVAKDNVADVVLYPVFEEIHYKLYLDPNGGVINMSGNQIKKKTLVAEPYYTESVSSFISESLLHGSKKGQYKDYVSTSKNIKGMVGYIDGYNSARIIRSNKLATKNNAAVTIYSMWYKVEAAKLNVYEAGINGTTLTVSTSTVDHLDPYESIYEVQYSPNSKFLYNVKSVAADENGNVTIDDIKTGQEYYVRARECRFDSTGNPVYGPWSATVRATKEGVATVTITFDAGAGAKIGTAQKTQKSYKVGEALGELPEVTTLPENKEFDGWYDAATDGNKVTAETLATATLTKVYAHYKDAAPAPTTVEVTFDAGEGGKIGEKQTLKKSVEIGKPYGTLPEVTTLPTGKRFIGWFDAATAGTEITEETVATAELTTIYAQYEVETPATVTVTFDLNGGTAVGSPELVKTVDYNAAYPAAPALTVATKEGYTLTGWNTKNDATGDTYPTTGNVTATVTYYAVWSPISYNIKFAKGAEEATGTAPNDIAAEYGTEYTLPDNPFALDGKTFAGWKLADSTTVKQAGDKVSNLTTTAGADVTITATWKDRTLSSIAVKTVPTKNSYIVGEKFNPAGLVITLTYDNAETEEVSYDEHSSDFTFTPDLETALDEGDNVTITYGGKSTTQAIVVTNTNPSNP